MTNQTRLAIASLSAALLVVGCSGGHDTSSTSSSAQRSTTVASQDSCGMHDLEYYRSTPHFRELTDEVKAYDNEHGGYDVTDNCSRKLHHLAAAAAGMHADLFLGSHRPTQGI